MEEFKRSWPIMGIALVMWLSVVILRTPALGFDHVRLVSILISTIALITLGVYIERVHQSSRQTDEGEKRK